MKKVFILGAGTWGLALAKILDSINNKVIVYSVIEKEIDELNKTRKNKNLDVIFSNTITFTKSLEELDSSDVVIFAIPSIYVRNIAGLVSNHLNNNQLIIDVAKGIEEDTLMTLSEVIEEETNIKDIVAMSGPTHAEEVAINLPTTIVAACKNINKANEVVELFRNTIIRVYVNEDIKGVELCGAFKNIIALATGISEGYGYGDNIKAALITRGIAEIRRLGLFLNCHEQTFSGLSGIGDLIVTATSKHSRNNCCGYYIGKGYSIDESIKMVGMVVEGLNALPAAIKMANKYNIDMPIIKAVYDIVNGKDVGITINELLNRPNKSEIE